MSVDYLKLLTLKTLFFQAMYLYCCMLLSEDLIFSFAPNANKLLLEKNNVNNINFYNVIHIVGFPE